ncbi:MAG TPA: SURF1 family protein [Natronosporangium sp.]|nr:SURF1 family protein [Natronosporangium sp.]
MYRFLLTPRWLGILAGALAVATVMVLLGGWQLSRYHARSEINARIDATGDPVPVERLVTPPGPDRGVGARVTEAVRWSTVTATGRYDADHQVLVRGRTVHGRVGYEVLTPLVLEGGAALLVDRGWLPPAQEGMTVTPRVPAPPGGQVTVVGRIHPGESGGTPVENRDGVLQARRINLDAIAAHLPYPLYGGVIVLGGPGDDGLVPVPVRRENAWLNAAYAVQWWIFAGLVLVGAAWLVRREAHGARGRGRDRAGGHVRDGTGGGADGGGDGAGPGRLGRTTAPRAGAGRE